MKSFNGYKAEVYTQTDVLPIGSYVCRIMGARAETTPWGAEQLLIQFDIDEGEYKDYFTNLYNNTQFENKKYKGVFKLNVPTGDGSQSDEWAIKKFNNCMGCIEESNKGFKWEWNEKALKDKKVGITFRNEEWAINGRTGWSGRPFNMATVESVRDGKVKLPKEKPLSDEKKKAAGIDIEVDEFSTVSTNDGDLPF